MIRAISANTYYEASAQRVLYAPLSGEHSVDVGVIGGGIAGCSTALYLAQRGYRVALLESQRLGSGASGRSGGQLLPGYSCGQHVLQRQVGASLARALWDVSVEGVQLAVQLIRQHAIECDLRFGHLDVAIRSRHRDDLLHNQTQLHQEYNYRSLRLIEGDELITLVNSSRYCAGLYDSAGAHVNPLNYTLGLGHAAARAGVQIYEHSAVHAIRHGNDICVQTGQGAINARFIVLCANVGNTALTGQRARIMPVATHMIATEPLNESAQKLLNEQIAVSDCNFVVDYFRLMDSRLLFGGGVSYSGYTSSHHAERTRQRMLAVFPQLRDVNIDYAWSGLLDISMNRAPDFGRLHNNIYYLQGFSGHGMALAGMAGKLVAESIAMQSERFDLFGRIKHRPFPGGALRTPLLMLAMLWYRLRDVV